MLRQNGRRGKAHRKPPRRPPVRFRLEQEPESQLDRARPVDVDVANRLRDAEHGQVIEIATRLEIAMAVKEVEEFRAELEGLRFGKAGLLQYVEVLALERQDVRVVEHRRCRAE